MEILITLRKKELSYDHEKRREMAKQYPDPGVNSNADGWKKGQKINIQTMGSA